MTLYTQQYEMAKPFNLPDKNKKMYQTSLAAMCMIRYKSIGMNFDEFLRQNYPNILIWTHPISHANRITL